MPEQGFTNFEPENRSKKPMLKDPVFYASIATAVFLKCMSVSHVDKPILATKPVKEKTETVMPSQFQKVKNEILFSFGTSHKANAPKQITHYTP